MNLLTLSQVAMRLGVGESTMRKIAPQLHGQVVIGKRKRWRADDVEAFILAGGCPKPANIRNGA